MELDLDNKEWQDALQIINYTRRSLFLTGKAGTGKSTFLRYVASHTKKKHVILAPTGIAAINAGGSTLHSFFRLPFHPLLPNDSRYSYRHIKETLKYTGAQRVLKDEDRQLLQPFYPSSYFFNAKVWQQMPIVSIELRKVYRQTDDKFISILDRIRNNTATTADLAALNSRVVSSSSLQGNLIPHSSFHIPQEQPLTITLATRRDIVDYTNEQQLAALDGNPSVFIGTKTNDG